MSINLTTSEDHVLLRRITYQEADALSTLYDRDGRLLYSVAYHLVGDPNLAGGDHPGRVRRVWEKAGTYRADRASVRTAHQHDAQPGHRHAAARRACPEHNSVRWTDLSVEPHADGHSPEMAVSHQLQNQNRAQRAGPAAARAAGGPVLAFFSGYSHSQIADQLNLPSGTVKTRIRLGMQKLRHMLQS